MSESLMDHAAETDTKAALRRALRNLAKAREKNAELVAAVKEAATDALAGLKLPPVKAPAVDRRTKGEETAVVLLSDWQLAKVTPSYSTAVCEQRIQLLAEKIATLTDIQRQDHPVKECRVYLLGDLIEGELIFPGQAHMIDASLFAQVLSDGPRILGGLLRTLAAAFPQVHVVGVIGNHGSLGGRARREYHPESNADAMMYEVTRMALQDEPRVTWADTFTQGERHWYATDHVHGKKFFLFHGDQIKGGQLGFPWYGFGKKLGGWSHLYGPIAYAVSGHFHTSTRQRYPAAGSIVHWANGSTESDNTYAAENFGAASDPCQWLLFVGDDGITAEYEVRL